MIEEIGDIFNRHNVAIYLEKFLPSEKFTIDDIELCYYIMSLLIQKSTHVECMENDRTDFCHDDCGVGENKARYLVPSGSKNGRRSDVDLMFRTKNIHIPCYGLDRQDEDDWKSLPAFFLVELLRDKKKLRIFFDYWNTVPDYSSVYRILNTGLNLPPDICDLILCMAAKSYG